LTTNGYKSAKDLQIGDVILTVNPDNLVGAEDSASTKISENVSFVEVEVTTNSVSQKELLSFNGSSNKFSYYQPIFVKSESVIVYKNTEDVVVGDLLVNIDVESGNVSYEEVKTIETFPESDVYEIRTQPHTWFIVGNYLVIS
jgi:hypothetical protein